MKKIIMALLCVCMVCGCSAKPSAKEVDLATLMTSIQDNGDTYELPAGMILQDEEVTSVLGIDAALFKQQQVYFPLMNVHATQILMFEANEGQMDALKKGVDAYIETIQKTWDQYLPDQADLVRNHKTVEKGNYYFIVIAEKADDIVQTIEDAFK